MLVPFLAVVLRVMMDDTGKHPQCLSAPDAADAILKAICSQASSHYTPKKFAMRLSCTW